MIRTLAMSNFDIFHHGDQHHHHQHARKKKRLKTRLIHKSFSVATFFFVLSTSNIWLYIISTRIWQKIAKKKYGEKKKKKKNEPTFSLVTMEGQKWRATKRIQRKIKMKRYEWHIRENALWIPVFRKKWFLSHACGYKHTHEYMHNRLRVL